MSELKLTLEPELESPSLGGVPTLTLDSAEAEKKPEPEVPEEPVLSPEEQKVVDDFVEKIDITSSSLVMQYGAGAQKKIANFPIRRCRTCARRISARWATKSPTSSLSCAASM